MPAIKIYKGNGAIIPVEQAKIVKGYICPFTKKVFSNKRGYVKHLAVLREDHMHRAARNKKHLRKAQDLWNQPSFEAIIDWCELNSDFFWEKGKRNGWSSDQSRWDSIRDKFEFKITKLDLTRSDCVSNSHNCPHNGITNWGGKCLSKDGSPAPRGYPGWHGRIAFQCSPYISGFTSDVLKYTRIHTGTVARMLEKAGGEYDVIFFDDDWPGLEKSLTVDILKGTMPLKFVYYV